MTAERGHIEPLLIGRYRVTRSAMWGAIEAARALGALGEDELSTQCRAAADRLQVEMTSMRVKLGDPLP